MATGVTLLAAGIGAGSSLVVRSGAAAFLLGVILFMSQIHRVVRGRPS
jgi:hypothetical protein